MLKTLNNHDITGIFTLNLHSLYIYIIIYTILYLQVLCTLKEVKNRLPTTLLACTTPTNLVVLNISCYYFSLWPLKAFNYVMWEPCILILSNLFVCLLVYLLFVCLFFFLFLYLLIFKPYKID